MAENPTLYAYTSTIAYNYSGNTTGGGGVFNNYGTNHYYSCIVYGNNAANGSTGEKNMAGGGSGTWNSCLVGGNAIGNGVISNANPIFKTTSAATAGAATTGGDYRLQSTSSPAYNTGVDSHNYNNWSYDLDGFPRKVGTIDLGAYEYQIAKPAVTTLSSASNITDASAILSATLTAYANAGVTDYGIVYATTSPPTTSSFKLSRGIPTATGDYSLSATGLTPATTYYFRAYIVSTYHGTIYGTTHSFTTAKKQLTISAPSITNTKTYDGTATVTVTGLGAVGGVHASYTSVTVEKNTATFNDKKAGSGKTITVTYKLAGADAGRYLAPVSYTVATGVINKKALTLTNTGVSSKTYDGTTTAAFSGTPGLSGQISGDVVTLTNGTPKFADKAVGTGKAISFSPAFSITGTDAGNYSLTQPGGVTASITRRQLAINAPTIPGKVYDGTDTVRVTPGALTNKVSGDVVSVTAIGQYSAKTPGSRSVTVTYAISGADAGSYIAPASGSATGTITRRPITVTSAAISPKTYDGTTIATVSSVTFGNLVPGEALTLGQDYTVSGAVFDLADAGSGRKTAMSVSLTNSTKAQSYALTGSSYEQPGQTIAKAAPTAAHLVYNRDSSVVYNTRAHSVPVAPDGSRYTGMGAITVKYGGSTDLPVGVGKYALTADVAAGKNFSAKTGLALGTFTVEQAYYRVTFDSRGGSSVREKTVAHGDVCAAPDPPTKAKSVFAGWHIGSGHGAPWNFSACTVTSDTTLYARWIDSSRSVCTVSFWTDNRTFFTSQTVAVGDSLMRPVDPVKSGFVFLEWQDSYSTPWNFPTDTVSKDVNLYALWIEDQYIDDVVTVTFDADGGSPVSPQRVEKRFFARRPKNPAKPGHIFNGWYKMPENIRWDFDKNRVEEDMTLYAQWAVSGGNHEVTFNSNGGYPNGVTQVVAHGGKVVQPTNPAKSGHTFGGWYSDAGCATSPWSFLNSTVTCDTTLYAKWFDNANRVYTVTFIGDERGNFTQQVKEGETVAKPGGNPVKTGYRFTRWHADAQLATPWDFGAGKITQDTALYAGWDTVWYRITYHNADGAANHANPDSFFVESEVILKSIVKSGYTFGGWYSTSFYLEESRVDTIKKGSTGNLHLYASWELVAYPITYKNVGGVTNPNPAFYTIESSFDLTDVQNPGYRFEGWYSDSISGVRVEKILPGSMGADTLWARWKKLHTVRFSSDGAEIAALRAIVAHGDTVGKPAYTPAKQGYEFAHWHADTLLPAVAWDFGACAIAQDTMLYAGWDTVKYPITYKNVAGAAHSNPATYTIAGGVALTAAAKAGYAFTGWYSDSITSPVRVTAIAKGSAGACTLWARWTIVEYSIAYKNVAGAAHGNPATYTAAGGVALTAAAKTGYTFTGWYSDSTGGALVAEIPLGSTGDFTLWARWTRNEYTVTFDAHGGSPVPERRVLYGDTAPRPEAPTRGGYVFAGWYADKSLATPWNFPTDRVTGSITLHARWIEDAVPIFTVAFATGTGSPINTQMVALGDTVTRPKNPVHPDSTFAGWYKDSKLTSLWNFPTDLVDRNVTLYARWIELVRPTCTVTFVTGTEARIDPQTVAQGDTAVRPTNPTKTGHTFNGWYVTPDTLPANRWHFGQSTVAQDTALYAGWRRNICYVSFDSRGAGTTFQQPVPYGGTVTKPANPVRAGYIFDRWYADASCSVAWHFSTDIVSSSITLYAGWMPIPYSITYKNADGAANTGNPTTYTIESCFDLKAAEKPGYKFAGWYSDSVAGERVAAILPGSTRDTTLWARWKVLHTVCFSSDGSAIPAYEQQVAHGETAAEPVFDLTKPGYKFIHWYADALNPAAAWIFSEDTVAQDTTLYAKWRTVTYAITYKNTADAAHSNPAHYTVEDADITLAPLQRVGYRFLGWYADSIVGWDTVKVVPVSSLRDTTLWARWQKRYTVIFDSRGGKPDFYTYAVAEGDTSPIPANPTKPGFIFGGWYSDAGLTTPWSNGSITGDATIYAKWFDEDALLHTVTFISNGSIYLQQQALHGKTIAAPSVNPTRPGYVFLHWYADAQNPAAAWIFSEDTVAQDTTLYAKWRTVTYAITYKNTADAAHSNPAHYTVEDADITLAPLQRVGYRFLGWYADSIVGWDTVKVVPVSSLRDTTLWARWQKRYTVIFDSRGGKPDFYTYAVAEGDTSPIPANPTKPGFIFGGWYSDAGLTTPWSNGSITGDATIYAKWFDEDALLHTVTFISNGSIYLQQQALHGKTIAAPSVNPTRPGYVFLHWYADAQNPAAAWIFSEDTVAQDTTLYARWTATLPELPDTIVINGVAQRLAELADDVIRYPIQCRVEEVWVFAPSFLSDTLRISVATFARDTVILLSELGRQKSSFKLKLEKPFEFGSIVCAQLGGKLLTVIKNPANNGRFDFQEVRWWRKDGNIRIPAGDRKFYYVSPSGGIITDTVFAEVREAGSKDWRLTCPYIPSVPTVELQPTVYPNPALGGVAVRLKANSFAGAAVEEQYATFYLIDVQGNIVYTGKTADLVERGITFPVPAGVYYLVLEGKAGKKRLKIVIGQ